MKPLEKDSGLFSDVILHLYKEPLNYGKLSNSTLDAKGGNPYCGDIIHLFVRIEKNKIADASFVGSGCAVSRAAASVLTEMIKGKTIAKVLSLSPEQVFSELGGIVQTRIKCATLALSTLKKGLQEYQSGKSKQA